MNFTTKLIVSILTISATIVGSIWTGFETLDGRMESKVKEGKEEVLTIVYHMKNERNALLKAQDDKVAVQFQALTNDMQEIKKDVRAILGLTKKKIVENKDDSLYTKNETKKEEESLWQN